MKDATHKQWISWHGKKFYLLGQTADGEYFWLREPTWDCDWYWGLGYVETFSNNRHPERSKDITMHTHLNYLMEDKHLNWFDQFKAMFVYQPFTNDELWKLMEMMKSLYLMREYADFLCRGGCHYTSNPLAEKIKDTDERTRINEQLIPEVWKKVAVLMGGSEE